jgi:hypothetical protein
MAALAFARVPLINWGLTPILQEGMRHWWKVSSCGLTFEVGQQYWVSLSEGLGGTRLSLAD